MDTEAAPVSDDWQQMNIVDWIAVDIDAVTTYQKN